MINMIPDPHEKCREQMKRMKKPRSPSRSSRCGLSLENNPLICEMCPHQIGNLMYMGFWEGFYEITDENREAFWNYVKEHPEVVDE